MDLIFQITLTATVASLILAVEHFFPWRIVLRGPLPRLVAYALGVAGLYLPLSALCLLNGWRLPLLAMWVVAGAGGLTTVVCHVVDDWLVGRARLHTDDEIHRILEREA